MPESWMYYFYGLIALAVILLVVAVALDIRKWKRSPRRQEREELKRLKAELKELRQNEATNQKILADTYSDRQLRELVEQGRFPAEKVAEYRDRRDQLRAFVRACPALIREKEAEIKRLNRRRERV